MSDKKKQHDKEEILKTLRGYNPAPKDIAAFANSVNEKEKTFREATKSQTPTNEDRMRCYDL